MCSGYSFRKFIVLDSSDVREVEQLLAVESDELEDILLEHYVPKSVLPGNCGRSSSGQSA